MKPRNPHPDYYIIMGAILVVLGTALIGAFFPIVELIASILTVGGAIVLASMLIGKLLKQRRLEHEAAYGPLNDEEQKLVLKWKEDHNE